MNVILDRHYCRLLQTGLWGSTGYCLEFQGPNLLLKRQFLNPRPELTFESENAAREHNRWLANNWMRVNAPDIELYERRAQQA
jgi:hypothetical protein